MLTLITVLMLATFLAVILSKRTSVLVALILVPVIFAVIAGFGGDIGEIVTKGIGKVAPTAALIFFAILFFGVLLDSGIFDPLIKFLLRIMKADPLRIVVCTAVLTLLVAVDGDGSSTYIIVVSALLAVYRRFGLRLEILATVAVMAAGTSTLLPWGGPVIKAATALNVDLNSLYTPLIIPQLAGAAAVIGFSVLLGKAERRRLGGKVVPELAGAGAVIGSGILRDGGGGSSRFEGHAVPQVADVEHDGLDPSDPTLKRPKLFWVNIALALLVMIPLIAGLIAPVFLFIVGAALALVINYPSLSIQRDLITRHAPNMIPVTSLIFAAGVFTGVLDQTGMAKDLALSMASLVPEGAGRFIPLATALLAFPLTFIIQQDTFYFAVLPVLAGAAAPFGIGAEAIARASVVAQPLHAFSPTVAALFVLLGMMKMDYGVIFRFGVKYGAGVSAVILVVALLTGAVPL
ncbi:CitMHS family transporter [Pseudarthrobacter sp. YAF2]|uniref:CitMHS family transporter n=1 Tax=Pseudarthrobacter sp. YAF2 TaxID=3233078 RepID=UPI003F9BAF46